LMIMYIGSSDIGRPLTSAAVFATMAAPRIVHACLPLLTQVTYPSLRPVSYASAGATLWPSRPRGGVERVVGV
jgi:hypothetical protein